MIKILGLVVALALGFAGCAFEAYSAWQILTWHVPGVLPATWTWYELTWINLAVSVCVRNFVDHKPTDDEAEGLYRAGRFLRWQFAAPVLALVIGYIALLVTR